MVGTLSITSNDDYVTYSCIGVYHSIHKRGIANTDIAVAGIPYPGVGTSYDYSAPISESLRAIQ